MDAKPMVLLVALRAQWLAAVVMLGAAMLGGSFLIGFSQLPGALLDAGGDEEGFARAIVLHMGFLAALSIFLWAADRDGPLKVPAAVLAVACVLTLPFAVLLGHQVWKQRDADWPGARQAATGIGGRMRIALVLGWWSVVFLTGALATAAYLGVLSGRPLIGLAALASAVGVQWGGLRMLHAWEPRTRTKTYANPMPSLPELPSKP